MSDNINHPSHYTQGGIECIDAIKSSMTRHEFAGYLKGNCIKYLWRYRNKGRAIEDLKKAQWYLNKLISENECECVATLKQDGGSEIHYVCTWPNE